MDFQDFRPFQALTTLRMVENQRHGPMFKMGMGKTVVTVGAFWKTKTKFILILCRKNGMHGWRDHILHMFPRLAELENAPNRPVHIFVQPKDRATRRATWAQQFSHDDGITRVFIMTHAAFLRDHDILVHQAFETVVIDEAKRVWSRGSELFHKVRAHAVIAKYFYPMTGSRPWTPDKWWTMLHLINPKYFGSYWKFVNAFLYSQETPHGGREILGIRNPEAWHQILRSHFTIIDPEDVGDEMPSKNRELIRVDLDDTQHRIYNDFDNEMMSYLPEEDRILIAKNSLERLVRWRQLFICPKILDPSLTYGSALEDLVEQLDELDAKAGHGHAVIFTPYKKAFPFIGDLLSRHNYAVEFLHGGISNDELDRRRRDWKQRGGVICSTVLYATSFELQPATTCFFLGYEWDPDDNEQAEDRLRRLDNPTKHPINCYYYCYRNTEDEAIAERVNMHHQHMQMTIPLEQIRQQFRRA